jgi:hypothetical protein
LIERRRISRGKADAHPAYGFYPQRRWRFGVRMGSKLQIAQQLPALVALRDLNLNSGGRQNGLAERLNVLDGIRDGFPSRLLVTELLAKGLQTTPSLKVGTLRRGEFSSELLFDLLVER